MEGICNKFDDNLREAILSALRADSRTANSPVRVGVTNAVAHLGGTVEELEIRDTVEAIVKAIAGIRGVVNRIEAPGAPTPGRSIDITFNS